MGLKKIIANILGGGVLGDFVSRSIYYKRKQDLIHSFIVPPFQTREELYDSIIATELKNDSISYLEFGVYLGESLKYWLEKNKSSDSRFYGFDTFTGLPEDWSPDRPKGSYSAGGKIPDIKDPRVEFIVGLFNATLPTFIGRLDSSKRKVIHLDADLYSSTMYVLNVLMVKLKKGDIIIFDEWGGPLMHEFKAFFDFFSYSDIKYVFLGASTGYQAVTIKIL